MIVVKREDMNMTTFTLEEFDAFDDDVIYDFANAESPDPIVLELTDKQREIMDEAYSRWVESLDPDEREVFEESTCLLDDAGLYYTLRINRVPFDREQTATPMVA